MSNPDKNVYTSSGDALNLGFGYAEVIRYNRAKYGHGCTARACLITLHLKRAPGSWSYVGSTYFWTLIPNQPTRRRVKMLPWQVIGKKLHRSRDITWHGHLREKVKFLVSVRLLVVVWVMVVVRVMVRVRVEC